MGACGASVRWAMPSRSRKARNRSAARRRVAGRVGGVDAGEALQEVELAVALGVEPVQQPVACRSWRVRIRRGRVVDDDAVLDDGEARRAADRIGDAARIVGVPDREVGGAAGAMRPAVSPRPSARAPLTVKPRNASSGVRRNR